MKFELLCSGSCTHPEKVTLKTGSWKPIKIPALFGLIEHPKLGPILFDTGYAEHFDRACSVFPYTLYKQTTPVTFRPEESAAAQLKSRGIAAEEVRHILLSHFHGDHIAGCRDFPHATFYCFRRAYDAVKEKRGLAAVRRGFVPALLPADFEQRVVFIDEGERVALPEELVVFDHGYDVMGDGSLLAFDLTGHAVGQFGLFFRNEAGKPIVLCADAVWSSKAYMEQIPPLAVAYLLFPDKRSYQENLKKLHDTHKRNPQLAIIPSHCSMWWERFKQGWK